VHNHCVKSAPAWKLATSGRVRAFDSPLHRYPRRPDSENSARLASRGDSTYLLTSHSQS